MASAPSITVAKPQTVPVRVVGGLGFGRTEDHEGVRLSPAVLQPTSFSGGVEAETGPQVGHNPFTEKEVVVDHLGREVRPKPYSPTTKVEFTEQFDCSTKVGAEPGGRELNRLFFTPVLLLCLTESSGLAQKVKKEI